MTLPGKLLVIPIFDAQLHKNSSYELCDGITLITLTDEYEERLREVPELIARYEDSLKYMKIGLAIDLSKMPKGGKTKWHELLEYGIFIAMLIRLSTGVPIDMPYWFTVDNGDVKGCGNTQISTYRTGNRYRYPLDDGKQTSGLKALQVGIHDISQKYLLDSNRNILIRAIEFTAISFQTKHILTRLVNNTIFLESLFSCSNNEISYQIASAVSWYLMHKNTDAERLELFSKTKTLYGYRSKIVHGSDISASDTKILENLLFSEEINTSIMQNILINNHVKVFSMKQNNRQEEIKALTLGADCELLVTCA